MSFILDALRKSDAERQRSATPGVADVRYVRPRPPRRREFWLPVLVVVLVLNLIILAVQWLRSERIAVAPAPAAMQPQAAPAGPAAGLVEPAPWREVRPLAQEADPVPDPRPAPPPAAPAVAERPARRPEPAVAEPAQPSVVAPAADADAVIRTDLPTAEQLIGSGVLSIPMLNLDLHVYAGTPSRRFVVVNANRYVEGDSLREGPRVEEITPDGVILAHQGSRFLLPRK